MKKFILFISIIVYSTSAYSQEVTREDYENYILETDSYYINEFANDRYFLVQRILHLGNRKYRVAYWNPNTGKRINGDYDGNQHYVVDFEQFVKDEKTRRIKRKEQRRIAAENEKKKQIELKKKEEEDRIQKEKTDRNKKRKKLINKLDENYLTRFFNLDNRLGCKHLELIFEANSEFISNDGVNDGNIEEIGKLVLKYADNTRKWGYVPKNTGEYFEINIGVSNIFDEKIIYYVDGEKTDFNFDLNSNSPKGIDNGLNFFKDKINNPFYNSYAGTNINELCEEINSATLRTKQELIDLLRLNKYSGNFKQIINYFIQKNILEFIDEYGIDIKCSVKIVKESKKSLEWGLSIYSGSKIIREIEIKFDKKKKQINSKSGKSERLYSGSYIDFIFNEKYKFSEILNQ